MGAETPPRFIVQGLPMCASCPPVPAAAGKAELEEGTRLHAPLRGRRPGHLRDDRCRDGEVLMVAHMNAEALARTLETGEAWYWSRSRSELWHKGATSGQIQTVVEMRVDCDQDAVLLKVSVAGDGGCCHTGRRSCFYRESSTPERRASQN